VDWRLITSPSDANRRFRAIGLHQALPPRVSDSEEFVMDNINTIRDFISTDLNQLQLIPTVFNFFVCVLMSFVTREVYIRKSYSLTGKMHLGSIIPILSTLALSLGLVGALSIVRFRTPIKEPEELVYLFLAIAIGLGYASGQLLITTVLSLAILTMITLWLSNLNVAKTGEYNLVINWKMPDLSFETLSEKLGDVSQSLKLVRLDRSSTGNTAVLLVVPNSDTSLDSVTKGLQDLDSELSVSFYESKTTW
jgi:hypothetical protein